MNDIEIQQAMIEQREKGYVLPMSHMPISTAVQLAGGITLSELYFYGDQDGKIIIKAGFFSSAGFVKYDKEIMLSYKPVKMADDPLLVQPVELDDVEPEDIPPNALVHMQLAGLADFTPEDPDHKDKLLSKVMEMIVTLCMGHNLVLNGMTLGFYETMVRNAIEIVFAKHGAN